MPKQPSIPHKVIVDFILLGNTTRDAKKHFEFKSNNIANLRVHTAFKALGIPRPRYAKSRRCEFCGSTFMARNSKQRTCGSLACQKSLILDWQAKNPDSASKALKKYRSTEKGRQNNLRMHRRRRQRGLNGSISERWNFAASEIKKSLRKLYYLAFRNPWEYRLQHVQKVAQSERTFTPRNLRNIKSTSPDAMWQEALRCVQTGILQHAAAALSSEWERTVNRIAGSIRTGNTVREWKKRKREKQFPSTT